MGNVSCEGDVAVIRNARKGSFCNLRTTHALNAQADQGLRCPPTESMDTVVDVDEQRMSRLELRIWTVEYIKE